MMKQNIFNYYAIRQLISHIFLKDIRFLSLVTLFIILSYYKPRIKKLEIPEKHVQPK